MSLSNMKGSDMQPLSFISNHAIERYQQRVNPTASRQDALDAIRSILSNATSRSRPRHWMRVAATAPGTRYLYSAAAPHVCLVKANGVIVTVHSRRVCAAWAAPVGGPQGRTRSHVSKRGQVIRWAELDEAA